MKLRAPLLVAIAALPALAACGGRGGNPSWRTHATGGGGGPGHGTHSPAMITGEFRPERPGAERYNDGPVVPGPAHPVADAILAAFREAAVAQGWPEPRADARLYAAAQDVVGLAGPGQVPPYVAVEFALTHHGVIEPSPEMMIVQGDERDPTALAGAVREKLPQTLASPAGARVGVGLRPLGGGAVQAVVLVQASGLTTEPIARRSASGARVPVRGRTLAPFGDPSVFVTGADGRVDKLPVVREGGDGFRAEVTCAGEGKRQVEVVGRGPQGVTVLANFPIWCGVAPPDKLTLSAPREDAWADAGDVERLIFGYLNQDREAHGLPPLRWDEKAAVIARGHSADMHANNFVAHVSPTTGGAADRARAGGLSTPLVLENVARAYSPGEAQLGFMNSPGHRANVLSSDATHVGIGVVVGRQVGERRELYVTQVFLRVPPPLAPAQARKGVLATLAEARELRGVPELRGDKDLDAIAQPYAEGLAKGADGEKLASTADKALDKLAGRYRSIVTVIVVVGSPEQVVDESLLDSSVERVGVGLAQGPHPQMGERAIWVVLLLGKPRVGGQ